MISLKKSIKSVALTVFGLTLSAFGSSALAQAPTVIPSQNTNLGGTNAACIGLADRIRTGDIHLDQIPCFIKYFTQTLLGIAGTISVIMIMYGGLKYILSGDEDKAPFIKTIQNALLGLAVSLMAWILVDLVVRFVTE
jgi:hypothetical protein